MSSDAMPYGYRILGPCDRERKLIDYELAFAAYADCDEKAQFEQEAFLSPFQYDAAIQGREVVKGGKLETSGFDGSCWSRFVWFDIDDVGNLERATASARRLCTTLLNRYGVDESELLVFYSGSKGYHVGLPTSLWTPVPSVTFHSATRRFAESIAAEAKVTIDAAIYGKVQPLRAPNSRHGKSGLYKRPLTVDELMQVKPEAIKARAVDPLEFELPGAPGVNERARADWTTANEEVATQVATAVQRSTDRTQLNRETLEFIREGAEEGERQKRLFCAAANLAEFDCPSVLAHALLTESARDSGLTPSETRRAIDNGLQRNNKI